MKQFLGGKAMLWLRRWFRFGFSAAVVAVCVLGIVRGFRRC